MRKGEQAREEMVKDVNGQILRDGVEVRRRWAEYFEQVLNVADVMEVNINVVGNWRMPVLGDLNQRAILLEEVGEAVNEMKSGECRMPNTGMRHSGLTSMAAVQAEDVRASFLFVGDLNGHDQEWLGSTTTNSHGVAAFDFATVSGCDRWLSARPMHVVEYLTS